MKINSSPNLRRALGCAFVILTFALAAGVQAGPTNSWKSLFNGKDLSGWEKNNFGGAGEVKVEDGRLIIGTGVSLTGVRRTNDLLRSNFEIEVEAMKVEGNDFFCGLTFPVQDSHATLVVGGWGGSLVGISSIDGLDASENEYTQYLKFENNKWYTIRLRVTDKRLQAWIDHDKIIDADIEGKKISMRPGEIEDAAPFGISTYQTTTSIREIKIRPVPAHIPRVDFIAGKKSHGPGEHEYKKALELLAKQLEQRIEFIDLKVHYDGWPTEQEVLKRSDTIVLYCDGSDHNIQAYPLLLGRRVQFLGEQMKRGAGLVCIHYSVFVPGQKAGKEFLDWVGGYFDYETGDAANKWYSKIETRDYQVYPATPAHPVLTGISPFSTHEEFYFKIRFSEDKKNVTPLITFDPDKKDWEKVVGWATDRPDGGRGFGYTGGHFLKNFEDPNVQRLLLNAILWTAHAENQIVSLAK